jgi:uncharacterized repeat protein (TIGR03803 family)
MKKHSMGLLTIFLSVLLSVIPHPVQAQTFKALYSFRNGTDGANPYAGLTPDAAGNLYGTTLDGGGFNFGTVFRLSKSGKEVVLHSFTGTDGEQLVAGLVRDAAGNFYGTTQKWRSVLQLWCGVQGHQDRQVCPTACLHRRGRRAASLRRFACRPIRHAVRHHIRHHLLRRYLPVRFIPMWHDF